MKITFKNFKQHSDRTFELPDCGLVNISGRSGAGKTTLLRGFQFALFDGVKKPYTHGTKTCSVELALPGLEITRSKGPNRLIANGVEDAAAQDLIQKNLGMTEAEFMASSYIQQKMQSSLLTLSPSEQLAFIERLAFGENSPEKIKNAINAEVLTRKKDIDAVTQKLEMIEKMISDQEAALQQVESLPVITSLAEDMETYSIQVKDEYDSETQKRDAAAKKLSSLNAEKESPHYKLSVQLDLAKQEAAIAVSSWNERLEEIESEIINLGTPWSGGMTKSQAEGRRTIFQPARDYIKLQHEITNTKTSMSAAQEKAKKARADIEKQISEFPVVDPSPLLARQKELAELLKWIEYRDECGKRANDFANKHPQCWEGVKGVKKYLAIQSFLATQKNETNQQILDTHAANRALRDEMLLLKQSLSVLECPECSAKVSLVNGVLSKSPGNVNEKIKEVTQKIADNDKKISDLQAKLPEIEADGKVATSLYAEVSAFPKKPHTGPDSANDVATEQKEVEGKLIEITEQEAKRKNLEYRLNFLAEDMLVKRYSEELEQKEKQLAGLHVDLNYVSTAGLTVEKIVKDEVEINEYIAANISIQSKINALVIAKTAPPSSYTRALSQVSWLEKQISGIPQPRPAEEIAQEFEAWNIALNDHSANVERLEPIYQQIKQWAKQKDEEKIIMAKRSSIEDQIAQLKSKLVSLTAEKDECVAVYEGTLELKAASERCQMEAVAGVVDSINIAAKDFLDLLFPDDACTVSLLPYKQTKDASVKAKFSTVIHYKGCEYTDIDEVSGGEYDRIVLAYQLALNSIYNSPILLLDEAFTAVEEELFLIAMDALKVVAKEKLILVISHGANQGVFDQVIEV